MDRVSVVIPTFNRPAGLRRAIESVAKQSGLADAGIELIVVDNSPQGNAAGALADISYPLRLLHEPRPGVANARNAGVRAATGAWIAFLDDDEEASDCWLAELLAAAKDAGADAAFGPVVARAEEGAIEPFEKYFSRALDKGAGADITDRAAYLGTNNSLFSKERCLAAATPFNPGLNETGGEDSLLLKQLVLDGRRFAWAPEALVIEWTSTRRLNWAYICKRKFLSGQIRVFVLRMVEPPQWRGVAFWMCVGLAQTVIGASAALALTPFGGARAARARVLLNAGLGKLFWGRRFRPLLYGPGHIS